MPIKQIIVKLIILLIINYTYQSINDTNILLTMLYQKTKYKKKKKKSKVLKFLKVQKPKKYKFKN